MSILNMETDEAKSTQQTLTTKHGEITGNLNQLASSVNALRSSWQGNSASQFFQQFDNWNSAMGKFMEDLSQMSSQLQAEIAEWEQAAAKFE